MNLKLKLCVCMRMQKKGSIESRSVNFKRYQRLKFNFLIYKDKNIKNPKYYVKLA